MILLKNYDRFEKLFNDFMNKKKEYIKEDKKATTIEKFTNDVRSEYPISLKVKDIIELTGYSQATVYRMLEIGEIPGAKKIRGWRVPRDVFLAWWYMDTSDRNELY